MNKTNSNSVLYKQKTLKGEGRFWESHDALRVLYQSEIIFPELSSISNREKIRILQRFRKIFLRIYSARRLNVLKPRFSFDKGIAEIRRTLY